MAHKVKDQSKAPLPKTIYGVWEPIDDDYFVSTDEDPTELVEKGQSARVGVYELVGYATVENRTNVRAITRNA